MPRDAAEGKGERDMPTIGVLLSGCGVYDGSEIHETTLTLYFLDRAGVKALCLAPEATFSVLDHAAKSPTGEKRSIRTEAARLARGPVADAATVDPASLDGLILPGGFGAVANLCNYVIKGSKATVHPAVAGLIRDMHAAGKPIGAMCLAPLVLALVLGPHHPQLTIGDDAKTAAILEETGALHVVCGVRDLCRDTANNLVTTPAYMLGSGIADIAEGIEQLVAAVLAGGKAS